MHFHGGLKFPLNTTAQDLLSLAPVHTAKRHFRLSTRNSIQDSVTEILSGKVSIDGASSVDGRGLIIGLSRFISLQGSHLSSHTVTADTAVEYRRVKLDEIAITAHANPFQFAETISRLTRAAFDQLCLNVGGTVLTDDSIKYPSIVSTSSELTSRLIPILSSENFPLQSISPQTILSFSRYLKVLKQEPAVLHGSVAQCAMLVLSGKLALLSPSESSLIKHALPGEMVGLPQLLGSCHPWSVSVFAVETSEILIFRRSDFDKAISGQWTEENTMETSREKTAKKSVLKRATEAGVLIRAFMSLLAEKWGSKLKMVKAEPVLKLAESDGKVGLGVEVWASEAGKKKDTVNAAESTEWLDEKTPDEELPATTDFNYSAPRLTSVLPLPIDLETATMEDLKQLAYAQQRIIAYLQAQVQDAREDRHVLYQKLFMLNSKD